MNQEKHAVRYEIPWMNVSKFFNYISLYGCKQNVLIYMGYNLVLAKRKDTKSMIKKEITWSIIADL